MSSKLFKGYQTYQFGTEINLKVYFRYVGIYTTHLILRLGEIKNYLSSHPDTEKLS